MLILGRPLGAMERLEGPCGPLGSAWELLAYSCDGINDPRRGKGFRTLVKRGQSGAPVRVREVLSILSILKITNT